MLEGSPAAQLTPVDPRQLGRWEVEARIGSGGMGVVYRARSGDEVAAVKVVRPGLLDDPQVAARFEREAQVLRTVHDEHISRFLDEDIKGTPAWLATEYVSGPNLRDAVSVWGPLSKQRWWQLARGLAQALAVLEIHGIAHRDIKPANVIINERGPVLIDFGIAHPEDAASLTATGIVTGSPGWLSPEQVGLQDVTAASDVFSLGSLLAFAATGRPPFGQGATVAVLMSIQRNDPDLDGVDRARAGLLQRMLAKDPALRPTAREVLEIARKVQGDDVTVAVLPPVDETTQPIAPAATPVQTRRSPGPRAARRKGRWWAILAVIASLIAATALGFAGFRALQGGQGQGAPPEQSSPAEPGVADAPPAPTGDQLGADDWLLSRYSISQDNGNVVVNGTVVNNGAETRGTDLTVYYYVDGQPVAVATGSTGDVPAGASASVTLTSDDRWQPGQPTLLVESG
jgi:tRNA A-37 threonylcarbamoyl transferase component Bud32